MVCSGLVAELCEVFLVKCNSHHTCFYNNLETVVKLKLWNHNMVFALLTKMRSELFSLILSTIISSYVPKKHFYQSLTLSVLSHLYNCTNVFQGLINSSKDVNPEMYIRS